jgi:hypothetical protein
MWLFQPSEHKLNKKYEAHLLVTTNLVTFKIHRGHFVARDNQNVNCDANA